MTKVPASGARVKINPTNIGGRIVLSNKGREKENQGQVNNREVRARREQALGIQVSQHTKST